MAEKCEICGKEYSNIKVHTRMAHEGGAEKIGMNTSPNNSVPPETVEKEPKTQRKNDSLEEVLGSIGKMAGILENLDSRLSKMENAGKGNEFKANPNPEDVEAGKATRSNVDPRIVNIVDEILGEDFGIEIVPNKDNPGFLFTIIVPERLSDLQKSSRPIVDELTGKYVRDESGIPKEEEYQPEDRRSRAIASHQSFDAIREHAERVRAYIVSYFQKMSRPVPEFRLKQNAR